MSKPRNGYLEAVASLYSDEVPVKLNTMTKVKRLKRGNAPTEEWKHQVSLVKWARFKGLLIISIPNHGKRTVWSGNKERQMGLTAGVSDLFLVHPNKTKHGYWIELKAKGKEPDSRQYEWMRKVRLQGYSADWFDDWEEAKNAIEIYLKE